MKKIAFTCLLIFTLLLSANCFASTVTNEGLNLSIPDEIEELLTIEIRNKEDGGMLFTVSETESIEAAKASGYEWNGAGWLFSIGCIDEEKLHEMLCNDMSGVEVFAKGTDGTYYALYHPTDVRMFREDYTDEEGIRRWTSLHEWAATVTDTFISENEGLTAEKHGNSILDIYLARILYQKGINYTVSTTEYGPVSSGKLDPAPYLKPLTEGVLYEMADEEETPDGEYVVLEFPEDDIRFDFFLMEGKENYIRQIWMDGQNEYLYKAVFDDETLKASAIMNDLYRDMVLANSLGYTPDDMAGLWTDKIAYRCGIEITKRDDGNFDVTVHWSSSAFETYFWSMTAVPTGNGAELRYENGKQSIITLASDTGTETKEEVIYENGTGTFNLLSTYELVWNDETGHAADDMLYIKE